jgi:hypothetical protein
VCAVQSTVGGRSGTSKKDAKALEEFCRDLCAEVRAVLTFIAGTAFVPR